MESCCKPDCKEPVAEYYPAFDRTVIPQPYCVEHGIEARRSMILEGPHLINIAKKQPELAKA